MAVVQRFNRGAVLDLDRRRIQRALRERVRYRYVQPQVDRVDAGYMITSPCCSRNVDPDGGVIEIAWIQPFEAGWRLYSRDHANHAWILREASDQLQVLLDVICVDAERVFWP